MNLTKLIGKLSHWKVDTMRWECISLIAAQIGWQLTTYEVSEEEGVLTVCIEIITTPKELPSFLFELAFNTLEVNATPQCMYTIIYVLHITLGEMLVLVHPLQLL